MSQNITVQKNNLMLSGVFISDVIEDFLNTKNSRQTVRSYRSDLVAFFNWLDVMTLSELAVLSFPILIDKVLSFIRLQEKTDPFTGKVKNPATVNRKAYTLSAFFNYLIHAYSYPKNPLKSFQAHKTTRKSTTESLTRAEAVDILQFMQGKHRESEKDFRDYLIFLFLNVFALRRNELVGLTWDDINVSASTINVYQKGGSTKLLPIPTNIMLYLQRFRELYPSDSVYLFRPLKNNTTHEFNKPLTPSAIYQMVEKIMLKFLPDKHITPHSFRKTFIELSIANKEDFVAITNATGHTNINMIGYYCTSDTLKHNAIHGMARLV